jgi:hypothetical protein
MAADTGHNIPNPTDVMKWASTQPFTNILLILILGAIAWVSHHVLTVSVPSHLQQIQDGYERIEKANREDRALIIQQYDKWFEFIQKRHDSTGQVTPENIIPELWRSHEKSNSEFSSVVGARGIAWVDLQTDARVNTDPHFERQIRVEIPDGTVVSWNGNSTSVVRGARSQHGNGDASVSGSFAKPQIRGGGTTEMQRKKWFGSRDF